MESDVVGVVNIVVLGGLYVVQALDALSRCSQISLAVNMEEDGVGNFLTEAGSSGEDGGGIEWVLEVEERRRAMGMVVRNW